MHIASVLVGYSFKQCDADPCIFVHTNDKGEKTYIVLFMDDFLIAGENEDDIADIKCLLAAEFDIQDLGIAKKFLGMQIEYGVDGSIEIHQEPAPTTTVSDGIRSSNRRGSQRNGLNRQHGLRLSVISA